MKILFADFETYYDSEYSLKKMTPVEYILDARFEAIGCAFKEEGQPAYWVDGPDLQAHFDKLDRDVAFVTHNALFDACIAAWKFNYTPRLIVDTLAISRACLGHVLRSHSLDSVSKHLGLGAKGTAILKVIGMRLADIKANGLYDEFVAYGLDDVTKCAGIFDKLVRSGEYPLGELPIADMVLRCAVTPKLYLDNNVLSTHHNNIVTQKNQLLATAMLCGADGKSDLMSNTKFADLLVTHGVTPPRKISKTTGQLAYAFAKTDKELIALEEHPNPAVQALVAARVGHKSTLEETRTTRLLTITQLTWPDGATGKIPIPLRNHAAHTHRLGGEWKLNFQNLPRKSPIRSALIAPPGHTIVVADARQIEARGVATLCGQEDLIAQFANDEDVYADFAAVLFGRPIDKAKRFIGKTSVLGLGFQSGWFTLQEAIRVQSRLQLGTELKVTDAEAQQYVKTYRSRYDRIPVMWNLLNTAGISVLANGGAKFRVGPCEFERERIRLPNGLHLFYHNLQYVEGQWSFLYGRVPERIYGGKLLENIIQALARIITMDAGLRICKRLGIDLTMQVHDELCFVVPDERVEETKQVMREEMRKRVEWAPNWPLDVEINQGKTYGDAK